ncbi:hypothetical protein JCM8202_002804 [Rhodotorula sphaerocarpa]
MPRSPSPARSYYSRSPSRSRSPTPDGSDTVKITKLTKNVTAIHLEEIFDVYGKIVDIDLPINSRLGTHKGTAWITFASPAAAAKASDYMDSAQVDGSVISVVIEPLSPPRAGGGARPGARGPPSPQNPRGRARSPPPRGRSPSRSPMRSRSRSPGPARRGAGRDRSPSESPKDS